MLMMLLCGGDVGGVVLVLVLSFLMVVFLVGAGGDVGVGVEAVALYLLVFFHLAALFRSPRERDSRAYWPRRYKWAPNNP